ncbi:cytochrome P450 [Nocardia sp. CA2R105]|uniref:cytochrome P450 n=1 Tax=Nocardia coffeae TaxID=2873381 RepID=UPI001CA7B53C|nr:cytochrome P450 [Nocardia coffeae]MBY8856590.1 cytochrome P450 [Nocardia coffeae]
MVVLNEAIDLFSVEGVQDPYPLYDRLRSRGPVRRIGDSAFYAVCGWDAVIEAVGRTEEFSSNLTAAMVYRDGAVTALDMVPLDAPAQVLATADDPTHLVHRKVLIPHLSARRINELESFAADTAHRLWEQAKGDGPIEWMGALANRLPMMVVAELIGVPADDVDQLIRWGCASASILDGITTQDRLEAAGVAALELSGYVTEHFNRAAAVPEPNLMGDIATRCNSGDMDQLTGLAMMLTLFSAGGESTASLLGSAMWILTAFPEIQRRLRGDPALLGRFIEEVLRYEPPFRGHYRHVRHDTTLAGTELAAGSHLLLLWGAANRDPERFDSPHEFSLDRGSTRGHLAFGRGTHFCVGAALARLEARIVLGMLLEGTTWLDAAEVGPWLPSILVRRLEYLRVTIG